MVQIGGKPKKASKPTQPQFVVQLSPNHNEYLKNGLVIPMQQPSLIASMLLRRGLGIWLMFLMGVYLRSWCDEFASNYIEC